MNRRSMLGMLGLGAAAGPVVAKEMIYQTSYPSPGLSTPAILANGIDGNWKDSPEVWNPVEQLAHARKEFDLMSGNADKWISDFVSREWEEYLNGYSSYRIETIDADIRNMKSFSESARIRMAIERKARRRMDKEKSYLTQRIQELLGHI